MRTARKLDRLTLAAIAASIGVMLQPWWEAGFRVGFFLVIASTLAQIAASHAAQAGSEEERG